MKKIVPIIQLAAKFAEVQRTIGYRSGHLENDAEHSYQLALVCWLANKQYQLGLKDELILKLALVHDLVEVYAGDTDAHDDKEKIAHKKDNEKRAFDRLKKEYEQFHDMLETIEKYERKDCAEAQLVYILDKMVPDMNIYYAKGDYFHSRKLDRADWKKWLFGKVNYESLDSTLKVLFDESVEEIENTCREIFHRKSE